MGMPDFYIYFMDITNSTNEQLIQIKEALIWYDDILRWYVLAAAFNESLIYNTIHKLQQ